MAKITDIEKALASHAQWATHLTQAIFKAQLDIPLAIIGSEVECELGCWLHGTELTADDKASAEYAAVRELHAEFHQVARRVAELALYSKKFEAYTLLYGEYIATSGKLALALAAWKRNLEQVH